MRFRVSAVEAPLVVQFEPSGMEYDLDPGDHLDVEWPPVPDGEVAGDVVYAPGMVTVAERGPGHSRAWNSDGVEVTT
ncbi:hypothetical protein ACFYNX_03835 [Streptomyces sp. NPDC007872]|uniref:hypothetical protein n=1 Tax=Streptomyces sp. NPDC007872 TaxID=3364782 RepID=UPI0036C5E8C0